MRLASADFRHAIPKRTSFWRDAKTSTRDACATQNAAVARRARFESKSHLDIALVLLRRAGRIERNIGDRLARLYQFVFD